ncbi:hypothetical protein RhiirA5_408310 [Rhizophagus irregularis]|uniref:Uncharacterized protein n=1 Tax=Rhizophagus irregularis TaxID=588596 RepID=A0A2I1ECR4_9GLOM|nr:hypothetical protein RhiirA5_408310 [Rhizophagus irregularis]PKY19928.1 hypothetical protein RhiirB3_433102 [Rhizophagus irregularis]
MNKERGWAARRSTLSSASWKVNFFVILVPLWNGLSTNGDVRSSDNIIVNLVLSNKHLEWVVIQQISNEQVRVVVNSTTEE